jgi:hypothetical protein
LDELDDLLDFAKNLDFDKYIGDMEITTMMDQVVMIANKKRRRGKRKQK